MLITQGKKCASQEYKTKLVFKKQAAKKAQRVLFSSGEDAMLKGTAIYRKGLWMLLILITNTLICYCFMCLSKLWRRLTRRQDPIWEASRRHQSTLLTDTDIPALKIAYYWDGQAVCAFLGLVWPQRNLKPPEWIGNTPRYNWRAKTTVWEKYSRIPYGW